MDMCGCSCVFDVCIFHDYQDIGKLINDLGDAYPGELESKCKTCDKLMIRNNTNI